MVVDFTQAAKIYIVCGKTDLRKSIDGLAAIVNEQYHLDVFDSTVFLFCGSRQDRYKALYWDGDGFFLLYKRIEHGRLQWPRHLEEVKALTHQQLTQLLSGFQPFPKQTLFNAKKGHFY